METPLICCEGVAAAIGGRDILQNVNIEIRQGDLLPVLGSNGSGKTTLLRLLLGLLTPSAGRVIRRKGLYAPGYCPQAHSLDPSFPMTVRDIISMGLGRHHRTIRFREELIAKACDTVGLQGLERRGFGELSGGQKRRTLVARALVGEPDVLILDEPAAELDEASTIELLELLKSLTCDKQRTVIFVHHGLSQALALSPRHIWVASGSARLVDDLEKTESLVIEDGAPR